MAGIHPAKINAVVELVATLEKEGAAQISLLGYAMAVACRSCGIEKTTALNALGVCMDKEFDMVPLGSDRPARLS